MYKKDFLRQDAHARRSSLSKEVIYRASSVIKSKFFAHPRVRDACRIMFYVNKGKEVRTYEMIEEALIKGYEVFIPVVIEEGIIVSSRILEMTNLVTGAYGIKEPIKVSPIAPYLIDVVVVPGLGFDLEGRRLGYGGGYYDRYLAHMSSSTLKVAFCYEIQLYDYIPRRYHDIIMDIIITEKRIISIRE